MTNKRQEVRLILMRHGESAWNKLNLFTGWVDTPLSYEGVQQALKGGEKIRDLPIDAVFTSTLIRAQMTAMLALIDHHSNKVPVIKHQDGMQAEWETIYGKTAQENTLPVYYAWQLNERMYGELQGCNKAETAAKFGNDQVKLWRRSYDVAPPHGESLKMTASRTLPYFQEIIYPQLSQGKNILIVAHGNSLRSIIMELDGLSQEQILELEIPLGKPIVYLFQNDKISKASL